MTSANMLARPWTAEEIADLLRLDRPAFLAKYDDRSNQSCIDKKRRVTKQRVLEHAPESSAPPPDPEILGMTSDVEYDIAAIRRKAEEQFAEKARRAEQKKQQDVYFTHGPVAIFFVGDQHIGNAGTDVGRMFLEQELICATPGAYVVLTGDTVDNFIVGKLIGENMKPSLAILEQWELAKAYVKGFGKRLIAVNSGNHNQWSTKLMGVDYDRETTPAGVLYDADEINFTLHVGESETRVRVRHKWRGNSIYNPSHAIERAARFDSPEPDVFVGAHVHQGATAREFILDGKRKLALMSSTYKVHDSYAASEGFSGNDASTAVALIVNSSGAFYGTSDLRSVLDYMRAAYRA